MNINRLMTLAWCVLAAVAAYTMIQYWQDDERIVALLYGAGAAWALVYALGWWRGAFVIRRNL